MDQSFDLVYTWVNNQDLTWKKDLKTFSKLMKPGKKSVGGDRFRDCQELRFSLISVFKYAPFIRNIYIVISNKETQIPTWLRTLAQTKKNLRFISHKEIFPEDQWNKLPTFNSISIEFYLHRIPELSENYLYFNDDMFFGSECKISDFLDNKGRSLIFLDKSNLVRKKDEIKSQKDYSFYHSCAYTDRVLDKFFKKERRYHLQHLPYMHNKETDLQLIQLLKDNNLLERSLSRFRENKNIKGQSLFYPYFSQYLGTSIAYFGEKGIKISKDHSKHYNRILKERPKLFCLNKLEKMDDQLEQFYKAYFGSDE